MPRGARGQRSTKAPDRGTDIKKIFLVDTPTWNRNHQNQEDRLVAGLRHPLAGSTVDRRDQPEMKVLELKDGQCIRTRPEHT